MAKKDELIDEHVSLAQCKRAVDALVTHETKAEQARNENELLPGKEPNVWLVVTVKKMQATHKIKPIRIPITHPIVDPRTTPVCLITKDPQREYKDLLEEKGIKFISRVVGIAKLKGKFKPFEARRLLLKENGMFLADDRIIPLLPKLLGSKWFEAKKQPIPVSLLRKDLKAELERAISSTYMHQNQGTCTSIKVGTLSQKPTQILSNVKTALPAVVAAIKDGWENIQSLHIKTNSSVSLPIWTCGLGDDNGGRWDGLIADEEGEVAGDADENDGEASDDDEEEQEEQVKPEKKGRKRAADAVEDTPKKKVKNAEGQSISASPASSKVKPIKSPKADQPSKSSDTTTSPAPIGKPSKGKPAVSPKDTPTPPSTSTKTTKSILKSTKSSANKSPKAIASPLSANTNSPVKSSKPPSKSSKPEKPKSGVPPPSKKPSSPPPSSSIPTLSASDLKKKRLADPLVKKKQKTVGLKDSKSVKAGLLGKKVARSS